MTGLDFEKYLSQNVGLIVGFKDALNEVKIKAKFNGSLGNMALTADKVRYAFKSFPVAGAVAELDTVDAPAPQATLGRIAAGAVIAGPVGAIIGGMLKKDRSKGYISVTLSDGNIFLAEFPAARVSDARRFVALINEASEFYLARKESS
jgi:hypothetical protein